VVGVRIARIEADRFLKLGNGQRELALLGQRVAEVCARRDMIAIDAEGRLVLRDGIVEAVDIAEEVREVVMGLGKPRIETDGLFVVIRRSLQLTIRRERDAEVEMRQRVLRFKKNSL